MCTRLQGKVALLTAAGQGIGRATAVAFAREGAAVWATDVNEASLTDLSTLGPEVRVRRLDVRDRTAIQSLIPEIGAIDVLFNCAGYVHHGSILECGEDDWTRSLEINVSAMYRTCQAVLPGMLARGRGTIVNVASAASSIKAAPNRFAYATTKAAVIGLTKAIAADFIQGGIRCNAICPGTIDSPSLRERIAAAGDARAAYASFVARQPLGRLGTPEEVAALAVYLASDESSFTTGQVHIIDGGWTM
jgi:2-keto-3-deoxy-L-fuconate dehydrogenase